jgi:hypothetical protein
MAAAILFIVAVRLIGGTILLDFLAPGRALAAWSMLHMSLNVKPTSRRRGGSA